MPHSEYSMKSLLCFFFQNQPQWNHCTVCDKKHDVPMETRSEIYFSRRCRRCLFQPFSMPMISNVKLPTLLSSWIRVSHWKWHNIPTETIYFVQIRVCKSLWRNELFLTHRTITCMCNLMKKIQAHVFQCYILVSYALIYKLSYLTVLRLRFRTKFP